MGWEGVRARLEGTVDTRSVRHPAWYLNLRADPGVRVEVKGEAFDAWAELMRREKPCRWAR